MTPDDLAYHARWKASSGHPSGWRVTRQFFPPMTPPDNGPSFQEAKGTSGRLRLFKTHRAAQKAANKLQGGK